MSNLIVVTPLPGEFVRGHIGRARRLNRKRDLKTTVNAIRSELSSSVSDALTTPTVRVLATFSGVSVGNYCKQHTILPLTSCVVDAGDLDCDGMWQAGTLKRFGTAPGREAAYFCPECAIKDLARGFSYWRRDHQIPGQRRCGLHAQILRRVSGPDAFNQQPSSFLSTAPTITCLLGEPAEKLAVVSRYEEIIHFLMAHDHVFDGEVLRRGMSTLGKEFSKREKKSSKPLLSAMARTKCPQIWLEELIPGIGAAGDDEFVSGLDYVFSPTKPMRTVCYALTLAMLFDRPLDAIRFIYPASFATDELVRKLAFPSSAARVANQVFRDRCNALIEHDFNFDAAAAKIGIDPSGLKDQLSRRTNGLMRELAKSPAARAVRRFSQGVGLDDACLTEGVNRKAVDGVIRLLLADTNLRLDLPLTSPRQTSDQPPKVLQQIASQLAAA